MGNYYHVVLTFDSAQRDKIRQLADELNPKDNSSLDWLLCILATYEPRGPGDMYAIGGAYKHPDIQRIVETLNKFFQELFIQDHMNQAILMIQGEIMDMEVWTFTVKGPVKQNVSLSWEYFD